MAGGYVPVDTPPGTAPLPLGQPAPAKVSAPPTARGPQPPHAKRGPTPSGKGRTRRPLKLRRRAT